jgi:hypothetical protein
VATNGRFWVAAEEIHIQLELFHKTVPSLQSLNLSFEVLRGISLEQARELAEKMNDGILGVIVTHK